MPILYPMRQLIGRTALCLCCLSVAACASLQDVSSMDDPDIGNAPPSVTNAQGPMRPQAAQSLLLRHWKNSHADTQAMAAVEELATSKPLIAGNRVTLLSDGPQTIAAMRRAIAAAKDHINLETYIFDEDTVGTPIADLLMERQRAGVQVHIIYDAVGTMAHPRRSLSACAPPAFSWLPSTPSTHCAPQAPWNSTNVTTASCWWWTDALPLPAA
ncbi:hypothetical protein [Rhodoferax sp. GW822-FHT02A01]|uniref:phospholipase D-like domain-containing protein n=1 Tax=Rhodoferax sp. GW822-FHT02A01 TaxID=3141537 RepID=UPI00315C7ABA